MRPPAHYNRLGSRLGSLVVMPELVVDDPDKDTDHHGGCSEEERDADADAQSQTRPARRR